MKRVELAIDIYAPAADIWAVLTAPSRYPDMTWEPVST
jgi:hypothetical protein